MYAFIKKAVILTVATLLLMLVAETYGDDSSNNPRRPRTESELRSWLENMVWYHRFSVAEISAATGLTRKEVEVALDRWQIRTGGRPAHAATDPLLVLPYPGGRHPRIGFLDGAIRPQRETKLSVFTPWDPNSYVVLDIPEAIWSDLGLTYLAHTHVPTIWDQQNIDLPKQEWQVSQTDRFTMKRTLPNGIAFGTRVISRPDHLDMQMWLHNGTDHTLSDLRVQNCVLLKAAQGFAQQDNDNKKFFGTYATCHSPEEDRWVIVSWVPLHRNWANPPCPCLHSDPRFPDCPPGETKTLRGWFSFYQGRDIQAELARIEATGWKDKAED